MEAGGLRSVAAVAAGEQEELLSNRELLSDRRFLGDS